jgi:hypothetical protein
MTVASIGFRRSMRLPLLPTRPRHTPIAQMDTETTRASLRCEAGRFRPGPTAGGTCTFEKRSSARNFAEPSRQRVLISAGCPPRGPDPPMFLSVPSKPIQLMNTQQSAGTATKTTPAATPRSPGSEWTHIRTSGGTTWKTANDAPMWKAAHRREPGWTRGNRTRTQTARTATPPNIPTSNSPAALMRPASADSGRSLSKRRSTWRRLSSHWENGRFRHRDTPAVAES